MSGTDGISGTVTRKATFTKVVLVLVCSLIAAMWVYAFGFAPRESINRVNDREWSKRAESICREAAVERTGLTDLSKLDVDDPESLARRAELIDLATDTLERAMERIEAVPPTDDKGREIAPLWIADYRQYLADRRDYAATIRSGAVSSFTESQIDGLPISEKIETFARANEMDSCIPPYDLSA